MATSNRLKHYTQLNTIPAIVGIVFAAAAGVQFLDLQMTLGLLDYTFSSDHALFVSLGALVVAFASSETRDFNRYSDEEQAIVGIGVGVMVASEYVTEVSDIIANNEPVAGLVAFAFSMAVWGVLAQ